MRYDLIFLLPERAFQKVAGRMTYEGGKGSSPPAPDYAGAANATAAGNLEAARATAAANRVNQITPYGSLTYEQDPSKGPDGGWTATTSLSPVEQQKLELTNSLSKGLLNTAQTGLGYVDNTLSSGGKLDESHLAQPGIQGQSVQDAIMARLQPQIALQRQSLETDLANKGLMQGSDAYKNAFTTQDHKENDLYSQAALQGISTGLQARQQGIQEQYAAQDRPLNIINALRTGNQVQTPGFVNVAQQGQTAGADLLGAATQQGNYATQAAAGKNAAEGQAASTALSAAALAAMLFS